VDLIALLAIQVLYAIASLALISVGLAIIFGMMRVINLAHGEFLMLGGYAAIVATSHGISIWIAMLVVAPIVVGIIGVIVELTIIRFLYGRMVDTMLATWGLSLFLVGLTTAISRRPIIACSTFTSPRSTTRSSRCWKISRSRSRRTPPRCAILSKTPMTTSNT